MLTVVPFLVVPAFGPSSALQGEPPDFVHELVLELHEEYDDNQLALPEPYALEVYLNADLLAASMTPPGGPPIALVHEAFCGCWTTPDGSYDTTAPIFGDYTFSLVTAAGPDQFTVHFSPTPTTAPALVTAPPPGYSYVATMPTFAWGSVAGAGSYIHIEVTEEPDGPVVDKAFLSIDATQWQPGIELAEDHEHQLVIDVLNAFGSTESTASGDGFAYEQRFGHSNYVDFATFVCGDEIAAPLSDENLVLGHECGLTPAFLETWQDEVGNQFRLECLSCAEFALFYQPTYGTPVLAGRCPWGGGENYAMIWGGGDSDTDGDVDCFVSALWLSQEPPPGSDGWLHYGDQGELGFTDWFQYTFTPEDGIATCKHFKSLDGWYGQYEDILVGSCSDLCTGPPAPMGARGGPPMVAAEFEPCDLDGDGDCDAADLQLAENALGACEGTSGYLSLADMDHDGCVTAEDLALFSATLGIGCGVNPPASLRIASGPPAVGSTVVFEVDNPLGTQAPGSIPIVGIASQPDPAYPCGTLLPGFGMAGSGAPGEILIAVGGSSPQLVLVGSPFGGSGLPGTATAPIPPLSSLLGKVAYAQAILLDAAPGAPLPFALTSGVEIHIGI